MELICIDGNFPEDFLKYYERYGVKVPQQDALYTVRDVLINSNGKTGFLLNELVNPFIPIDHPLFPDSPVLTEPNWDAKRFRALNGDVADAIEIRRELKLTTKQKVNYEISKEESK